MRDLHHRLIDDGHESYIFWGRRHNSISDMEQCCASKIGVYTHGVLSRITDRAGFYSKADTKKLIIKLEAIDPDVVHLHNIHGYYVNIELLFEWLVKRNQTTIWTLHDCWAFTGHCSHFSFVNCEQWKTMCSCDYPCPQKHEYPKSLLLDNSRRNYKDKKRIFTSLPSNKLTIITPSIWLSELVRQSYLSKYPIEVHHNEIDRTIFKFMQNDFKEKNQIERRLLILGVASPWSTRKGLDDFKMLAERLDSRFAIVLVGLTQAQIKGFQKTLLQSDGDTSINTGVLEAEKLVRQLALAKGFENSQLTPKRAIVSHSGCVVILLQRTDTRSELVELYSAADVFFNPTREDNYPTVNLEAEACGTPVYTYDTGGCAETIKRADSKIIRCEIEGRKSEE